MLISLCGAVLFGRMALSNARFRISPRNLPVLFGLFALLGAYMIVQILPLGALSSTVSSIADPSVIIPLSTISLTPHDTFLALARWASYGLLFFMVMQITSNPQRARAFINLIYWAIVIHAVVGLLFLLQFGDTILGIPKWKYFGSAMGGFINRNSFATFLAFGSVLGINLDDRADDREALGKGRQFGFGNLSRQGRRRDHRPRLADPRHHACRHKLAHGSVCRLLRHDCLGRPGACQKDRRCQQDRRLDLAARHSRHCWPRHVWLRNDISGAVGHASAMRPSLRMQLYQQVLQMIETRPLLGFGGNSFEYAYPLFHQAPVSVDLVWDKAHSTYLALWAEYGVIFGSVPLLIVGIILFQLSRAYVKAPGQEMLIRCGLCVILVGAVHSLVDFSLEIEAVTFAFVAIVATAWARQFELGNAVERDGS